VEINIGEIRSDEGRRNPSFLVSDDWIFHPVPATDFCRTSLTSGRGETTIYRKPSQAYRPPSCFCGASATNLSLPLHLFTIPQTQRFRLTVIALSTLVVLASAGIAIWRLRPVPPPRPTADLVVVHKSERRLDLYQKGVLLRSYVVSLGPDAVGAKWREGDGKTPEGQYRIDYRKEDSSFHRALHISYPEPKDIAAARARGLSPGGLVMIHGTKNGLSPTGRQRLPPDWTDGCIAVTDREIDEIWRLVPDGTKIVLEP
jgi:lipoprotein-anchoring transpeptidase ErfK/SrfK